MVWRACGAQSIHPKDLACRDQHKSDIVSVHYEIAASQSSTVAREHVAELQRHGRRLIADKRT
jgi:hypothetical protein